MTVVKRLIQLPLLASKNLGSRFGAGVKPVGVYRLQTTLQQSPNVTPTQTLPATSQISDARDFSTQVQSDYGQALSHAVLSASALAHQTQRIACAMDIAEAASDRHNFDKILLLINHGEAAIKKNNRLGIPLLTGTGVGQALTLAHQTSMFCTNENGLSPELVVLAPLGQTIQTVLHAFPYNTPDSVRSIPWICHKSLCPMNVDPASSSFIAENFPGMDLSQYESNQPLEGFLEWLKGRNEQVIVVSSTSDLLQSFCNSVLDCDSVSFQKGGEMKAVGLL